MDEPEVIEEFYGVYLLYCMNEKYLGRTYIGYTVDPNRRINQHNKGAWAGGARRTSNRGPWKMVMIIHGFPNNISALRFEWAWQNPDQSRRFLHVANRKKLRSEKQLAYRLRILSEMLRLGPWNRLPLTIRWLAEEFKQEFPPDKLPPIHMPICQGPVKSKKIKDNNKKKAKKKSSSQGKSQSPKKAKNTSSENQNVDKFSDERISCLLCYKLIENSNQKLTCLNVKCELVCHIFCLAELFLECGEYVPIEGDCPLCCQNLLWGDLIRKMKGCNDFPYDGSTEELETECEKVDDLMVNDVSMDSNNLNSSFSFDESD